MRIETHYGRDIVCGHIYDASEIKPDQMWQGSSGHVVTVNSVNSHGVVSYSWTENGEQKCHQKDSFSFQCRYCLVVSENKEQES